MIQKIAKTYYDNCRHGGILENDPEAASSNPA